MISKNVFARPKLPSFLWNFVMSDLTTDKWKTFVWGENWGELFQICGHWHKKPHPFPPRTCYYHYLIGPDAIELIYHIWKQKATYTCKNKRIWKEYFLQHGNLFCGWLSHANPEMFFLTKSFREICDHTKSNNKYECFLTAAQLMRNFGLLKYSTDFVLGCLKCVIRHKIGELV